jgi:ATP-dependent Clp protease ATP-binding subunit ClpC
VRRRPYSVVLFDEIEKAHPDVFNILLQILEEGKLTDSQGRKVDFRNVIVIMTSNIGSAQISKNQSLGFSIGDESGLSYDDMKDRVMGELKKVFRPELLNRIDEIIVFPKLAREEILHIVDLMLNRLRMQMAEHEVTIELTQEAKELLVEKGYDPTMGARPLRRGIQRFIEDPLADFVLGRTLEPGSTILVARKNEEEVDISIVPPAAPVDEKVTVPPEEPLAQPEESPEDEAPQE